MRYDLKIPRSLYIFAHQWPIHSVWWILVFGSGPIPIRLLVVDDHEMVRMGVRILLADRNRWEICGEAQNGAEAVEKVAQLSPDVVILDLTMPVMSGCDAAQRIRQIAPSTKIVFFSIHELPASVRLADADAFVSKASSSEDLVRVITELVHPRRVPEASQFAQ